MDCGFLPITIRGELGMDFLGTCFDMGGWLRRQRSVVELGVGDEWQALL